MIGSPDDRQMAGFKDFYQFTAPTRVISGRDLLASTGFRRHLARLRTLPRSDLSATFAAKRQILGNIGAVPKTFVRR